jgi:hypothetical protein
MSDAYTPRPGDTEAALLAKIANILQTGSGGGGGSGGAVTIADGADVTLGAKADAAVTNPASSATAIALLKGLLTEVITNANVGGFTKVVTVAPTVSTSPAYTAGDAVGGKQTLANVYRTSGGTAILESIQILDRANQKAAMEFIFFESDPSSATITDNSAFVYSTDDLKVLGHVTLAASDYVTLNSKAVATLRGLNLALQGSATTSLYVALVTTGTPTYANTTDIQIKYGFLQD